MNNTMPFLYPNTFDWGMNDKQIENRITNLEREISNLRNRITRLENNKSYNDNYSNNYQPNSYNMM